MSTALRVGISVEFAAKRTVEQKENCSEQMTTVNDE